MNTQRVKKQNLNFGQEHRSKNDLGKKQGMENPKRRAAPRSSAPVAKRPKWQRAHFITDDRSSALFGSRDSRQRQAKYFRRLHDLSCVFRYHIQAGAPHYIRLVTGFGIPWVSVHGIDSICVVARSKDMRRLQRDLSPLVDKNSDYFPSHFWNTIISEVEDIAASSGESRQLFNKCSKKPFSSGPSCESSQMLDKCSKSPFGVVSVIEDPNKVFHKVKDSSAEYDSEKAIKFLQDEMESGAVFTFDKTTQTAIFAFWHLFRQEIGADDIRAFVLKNDEPTGRELKQIREDPDIEEFLAMINGA